MYYHRLIISYKGTAYFGWQDLGVSNEKPTIQACIQDVLNKICKYQSSTISVASRTDAGVHAQRQVLKIAIPLIIPSDKLQLGMNSLLPNDIRVLDCQPCSVEFNANKHSKSKEYHYYFCTDTISNPISSDIVAHIPSDNTSGHLNIELMNSSCNLFVGKHDFYSFAKRDSTMITTFRTVISCEILKIQDSSMTKNTYYLKIIGEGFLRHMVRYIAGALFALGRGQLSLDNINDALMNHKEEKITSKVKSKGLHLIEISY